MCDQITHLGEQESGKGFRLIQDPTPSCRTRAGDAHYWPSRRTGLSDIWRPVT